MTAGSPAKFPDNTIVAPYSQAYQLGILYSYGTALVRAVYNLKQEYTAEIQWSYFATMYKVIGL